MKKTLKRREDKEEDVITYRMTLREKIRYWNLKEKAPDRCGRMAKTEYVMMMSRRSVGSQRKSGRYGVHEVSCPCWESNTSSWSSSPLLVAPPAAQSDSITLATWPALSSTAVTLPCSLTGQALPGRPYSQNVLPTNSFKN
jgi:hypothetical protein